MTWACPPPPTSPPRPFSVGRYKRQLAEMCVQAVLAVADLERRDVNLELIKLDGKARPVIFVRFCLFLDFGGQTPWSIKLGDRASCGKKRGERAAARGGLLRCLAGPAVGAAVLERCGCRWHACDCGSCHILGSHQPVTRAPPPSTRPPGSQVGGRLEDTQLVRGIVLDKDMSHPQVCVCARGCGGVCVCVGGGGGRRRDEPPAGGRRRLLQPRAALPGSRGPAALPPAAACCPLLPPCSTMLLAFHPFRVKTTTTMVPDAQGAARRQDSHPDLPL